MIHQVTGLLARLTLLAALGVAGGFLWFIAAADRAWPPPPHADGILALTGGPERVETALHLLAAGQGDMLLVSGVAPGASLADLARRADLDPARLAARTTLGHAATSTVGNAAEAAAWAQGHALHSVIVVTAGYHMPRALLELARTMPGVTLYPLPVQPAPLATRATARLLLAEYVKLLGAWAGLSQALPQRPRTVSAARPERGGVPAVTFPSYS